MKLSTLTPLVLVSVVALGLGSQSTPPSPVVPAVAAAQPEGSPLVSLPADPGEEVVYELELVNHLQTADPAQSELLAEPIRWTGQFVLRSYERDPVEGTLVGIKIAGLDAGASVAMDKASTELAGELFFRHVGGEITHFYVAQRAASQYLYALTSIALSMQTHGARSRDARGAWLATEKSINGAYRVQLRADFAAELPELEKRYLSLVEPSALKVVGDSRCMLTFDGVNNHLKNLRSQIALQTDALGDVTLAGEWQVTLNRLRWRDGLPGRSTPGGDTPLLTPFEPRDLMLAAEGADAPPEQILKGAGRQDLHEMLLNLNSAQDSSVADLYNKLEALLALDPAFGVDLLNSLRAQLESLDGTPEDKKSFAARLSVIMGALASMPATAIEGPLLEFAQSYMDDEVISQQTAFALASLEKPSSDVRDFLGDMAHSKDTNVRTIGQLSLGSLGRQDGHTRSVREQLHRSLEQASDEDRFVVVAAMANSHDPRNVELFGRYVDSTDEALAVQAVHGLKKIPGERAFSLLQQVVDQDDRTSVLRTALRALAGHVARSEVTRLAATVVRSDHPDSIKREALGLLAQRAMVDKEAKSELVRLAADGSYTDDFKAHAAALVRTL